MQESIKCTHEVQSQACKYLYSVVCLGKKDHTAYICVFWLCADFSLMDYFSKSFIYENAKKKQKKKKKKKKKKRKLSYWDIRESRYHGNSLPKKTAEQTKRTIFETEVDEKETDWSNYQN